jgi:hypothetical protein
MPVPSALRFRLPLQITVAMLAAWTLAGCASAPVQEMSDARQAIRAAQEAGAERTAATQLSEAQIALNRAQGNLDKRFFRIARRNAEEAHRKAVEALNAARGEKSADKN